MSDSNWFDLARSEGYYDVSHSSPETEKKYGAVFSENRNVLTVKNVIFRRIPSLKFFYISKKGVVRNVHGRIIRSSATSNDSQVRLQVGSGVKNYYRNLLVWEAWPELAPKPSGDGVRWLGRVYFPMESWPGYVISRDGLVIREKNWTLLSENKGRVYMSKDGKQHSRAVSRLLFETFGMVKRG